VKCLPFVYLDSSSNYAAAAVGKTGVAAKQQLLELNKVIKKDSEQ